MSSATAIKLPERSTVPVADTWDLSKLFNSDAEWETAFEEFEQKVPGFAEFKGKLGENASSLRACLDFDCEIDRAGERLGVYAYLKTTEDQTDSAYQRMMGRFVREESVVILLPTDWTHGTQPPRVELQDRAAALVT